MSQLILTNRLYRFIKSTAIVGPTQAGVELITNSNDAYIKSELEPPFRFDVVINYSNKSVTIWDQAIGLTSEEMINCFGQVGNYTSDKSARGYFSRGAKDITAIGDATFVGIKNGKISEVTLTTTDIFTVIRADEDVTLEDREKYQIIGNGFWNQLMVKDSIEFPIIQTFGKMSKYFSLRDIFSDPRNEIYTTMKDINNNVMFSSRASYTLPAFKETLIDEEYTIDGYDGITAKFQLYLLEEPAEVSEDLYMEYGVVVSSGNAIHEISTLYNDIRNHPYIRYIYGRIECSYINDLLYNFENLPDDELNPFPIIDHSRLNGLNRSHPFTKALFRIPHKQLKYVLQDLYETEILDNNFSQQLSSLFQDIEIFGKDFFKEYIGSLYPYKLIDKGDISGFLVKKSSNIVTSSSESKFDFSNSKNFTRDSNNQGNVDGIEPSFNIIFTEKDYMQYPYYIYRLDNQINLEINIKDYLISKYISRNENGEIVFANKEGAYILLLDLVTEAMARESLREKYQSYNQTTVGSVQNPDSVFEQLEQLKLILTPKIYNIIVKEELKDVNII